MEKLGVARQRRRPFAGLLTGLVNLVNVAFFVMAAGQGFSITGPDDPLKVQCEADQENLEVGRAFSVTLMVNHGEILEVLVVPPDLREKFRLERQQSSTRLVRETPSTLERWSVFEFTLVPLEAGAQRLAPFGVRVYEQFVWTTGIPLVIAPARAVATPPTFRWETPFPALKVGEWSVFRLLITNADTLRPNALQRLRFEPPPEAIVESAVMDPGTNRPVIELRVLPLRPGPFAIKIIDFDAETRAGPIMRLRIPELRATIR